MKLPKKILLERLNLINVIPRTVDIDPEILYDEEPWSYEPDEIEWFEGCTEIQAPKEVFDKINKADKKPHSYFGLRDGLIRNIRDSSKRKFSFTELRSLLDKGDGFTLGDFGPLGTKNDAFSRMNQWYFGSMGRNAFSPLGEVPGEFSNDPLIQIVNARNLYERSLGMEGDILLQKWGSAGAVDPIVAFLNQIRELDRLNGTSLYKKIKYESSDLSEKSVEEGAATLGKKHYRKGLVDVKIRDVSKRSDDTFVTNIESGYLYDSISQPVIAKVNGKFYEIHFRPYVDSKGSRPILLDGTDIEPEVFARWLIRNNMEMLSLVNPKTFSRIRMEQKLVGINMNKYPNGCLIQELTDGIDNISMPTGESHIESIQYALDSLREGGYIQIFDLSIAKVSDIKKASGFVGRFNGSIYMPVNFLIIEKVMKERGYRVRTENVTEYMSDILGHKVFPAFALSLCGNHHDFDEIFPFELMKDHEWIRSFAEKIKREYGYNDKGRKAFYDKLKESGLVRIYLDQYDRDMQHKDYLSDLRNCLMNHAYMHFGYDGWVHQYAVSKKLYDYMDKLGFERGIADHFFENHKTISEQVEYDHMIIEK